MRKSFFGTTPRLVGMEASFSRAAFVVEGNDIFGRPRHVGGDEADAWIKVTSALSPPFVNAGVRFLAPLPGKGGIVGIPFGSAAIVGGRIVGVK
jgi:hypothetical protein